MGDQQRMQNYVKVEQKNISKQRQQEIINMMQLGIEEKYNDQENTRNNMKQERSNRLKQQDQDRMNKVNMINIQRANIDAENKRKEAERLKKMEIKSLITKINNLLDIKSCGIDPAV